MGRWIPDKGGKITDENGAFLGRAVTDAFAVLLAGDHNADCDAYESGIAELTAERDELADKEQCSHELFEAACNDLGDAQEEIATATKTLSLALKHLHGDDYTLDGTESISTLATIAMHAMAGE